MRKDVKFGMALSLVAVVVAGWYFARGESQEESIPLAADVVSDAERADLTSNLTSNLTSDAPATSPESSRHIAGGEGAVAQGPGGGQAISTAVAEPRMLSQPVADSQTDATPQAVTAEKPAGDAPRGVLLTADRSVADKEADSSLGKDGKTPPFFDLAKAWGTSQAGQEKSANFTGAELATIETDISAASKTAGSSAATRTARRADSKFGRVKVASPDALADRGDDAVETYKVQPGDSFAVLAEVYYGSQRYTQFLMDANPKIARPEDLRVGMLIRIPPLPESSVRGPKRMDAKGKGKPRPGERFYVVKKNDSFYRIAQRELGSAARWRALFEMNKGLVDGDSNGLRPGMTLRMPK